MQHYKNKGLKLEDIIADAAYAATLSPQDDRDFKDMRNNELTNKNIIKTIRKHMQYFRQLQNCTLELYPELSPTGRLHYHGYIKIRYPLRFYFRDLMLLNRISYEIDTLSDIIEIKDKDDYKIQKDGKLVYKIYITKQEKYFKELLEEEGMEYPIKINNTIIYTDLD